jgi:hypothetical protein
MLALKKLYHVIYEQMENFILQLSQHMKAGEIVTEISEKIKLVKESKDLSDLDALFESLIELNAIFELICFTINNEEETSKSVAETPLMNIVNIGKLLRDFDSLFYEIYSAAKITNCKNEQLKMVMETSSDDSANSFEKIFPDSVNIFGVINGMMLNASPEIVTVIPKDASVVSINIKNTTNIVTNIQAMIDKEYVSTHFPDLTTVTGLCEQVIRRFNDETSFTDTPHDPYVSGDIYDIRNIYQYLGDHDGKKHYRKLTDYPAVDTTRNYGCLGLSIYAANMENKRLLMMRNIDKRVESRVMSRDKIGEISSNYRMKKSLGGAVIDALLGDLTQEQNLKLLGYALEYDSNGSLPFEDPRYFLKSKNFRILENI